MSKEEISIVSFDMKYLDDYYNGFNAEITKYQWPDPFNHVEDARALLLEFLMRCKRAKHYSILFFPRKAPSLEALKCMDYLRIVPN